MCDDEINEIENQFLSTDHSFSPRSSFSEHNSEPSENNNNNGFGNTKRKFSEQKRSRKRCRLQGRYALSMYINCSRMRAPYNIYDTF